MGAIKGSATFLRFLVEGPRNDDSVLEESIEARRFLPLSADADALEQAGWVPSEAPFEDDVPVTRDMFAFGDLILISYREDKYSIPRQHLNKALRERLQKIVETEDDGDKKVKSKAFRKAVEAAVLIELKRKTLPRSKVVEVVWDTKKNEARVFAKGAVAKERVAALFERTFGVRMHLATFSNRALSPLSTPLAERELNLLEQMKCSSFIFTDIAEEA